MKRKVRFCKGGPQGAPLKKKLTGGFERTNFFKIYFFPFFPNLYSEETAQVNAKDINYILPYNISKEYSLQEDVLNLTYI